MIHLIIARPGGFSDDEAKRIEAFFRSSLPHARGPVTTGTTIVDPFGRSFLLSGDQWDLLGRPEMGQMKHRSLLHLVVPACKEIGGTSYFLASKDKPEKFMVDDLDQVGREHEAAFIGIPFRIDGVAEPAKVQVSLDWLNRMIRRSMMTPTEPGRREKGRTSPDRLFAQLAELYQGPADGLYEVEMIERFDEVER